MTMFMSRSSFIFLVMSLMTLMATVLASPTPGCLNCLKNKAVVETLPVSEQHIALMEESKAALTEAIGKQMASLRRGHELLGKGYYPARKVNENDINELRKQSVRWYNQGYNEADQTNGKVAAVSKEILNTIRQSQDEASSSTTTNNGQRNMRAPVPPQLLPVMQAMNNYLQVAKHPHELLDSYSQQTLSSGPNNEIVKQTMAILQQRSKELDNMLKWVLRIRT
jgi:hypothetical protein